MTSCSTSVRFDKAEGETDDQTSARALAEIKTDRKHRLLADGASEQNVQFTS